MKEEKDIPLFGRRLTIILTVTVTVIAAVKGATIPPLVHHIHHHTHYLQLPLQADTDPVDDPIPSSGDVALNPWLYRFPPWGGLQNPSPPSLKLTNGDALRSRTERAEKEALSAKDELESGTILEEISISGSDPYKDQVIQTMIDNEFKDTEHSIGPKENKPLIINVEYDKPEYIDETTITLVDYIPAEYFEGGFIPSQVINPESNSGSSMFVTTERINNKYEDRQNKAIDYPSNYKKSFDGMDLIPSKFLHYVDKKIFSPPANIVSVPKFDPLPLQDDGNDFYQSYHSDRNNHRVNTIEPTVSKATEQKPFRPSQRYDFLKENLDVFSTEKFNVFPTEKFNVFSTEKFVPPTPPSVTSRETNNHHFGVPEHSRSVSAERSLSELINQRWTRPAKRKTIVDDKWIWHR